MITQNKQNILEPRQNDQAGGQISHQIKFAPTINGSDGMPALFHSQVVPAG